RLLYGAKHQWGQPEGGTKECVTQLASEDVAKFHATYFVPQNAFISVSGDVTPDQIVARLDQVFAAWKGTAPPTAVWPAFPDAGMRHVEKIDHPGTQSVISVIHRMLSATDPDLVPMRTANFILGGLFS